MCTIYFRISNYYIIIIKKKRFAKIKRKCFYLTYIWKFFVCFQYLCIMSNYVHTYQLPTCGLTSSAATQRLHKNRAQPGMAFPNLIYWRHLDKSQSVISFDVVQKTRLPRERSLQEADTPRIDYHYVTWARLPPCSSCVRTSNPGEKARIINVRAGPLMDRGSPIRIRTNVVCGSSCVDAL